MAPAYWNVGVIGAAGTWCGLKGHVVWRLACWASTSEGDLMPGTPATHGNDITLGATILTRRKKTGMLVDCGIEAELNIVLVDMRRLQLISPLIEAMGEGMVALLKAKAC